MVSPPLSITCGPFEKSILPGSQNLEDLSKPWLHSVVCWQHGICPNIFDLVLQLVGLIPVSELLSCTIWSVSSISFIDFSFTCSCNSRISSNDVPGHSALLRAVYLTHLLPLNMDSRRLHTGQHCSLFHLSGQFLAHHLHLDHVIRTCLLRSTPFLNTETSSLFADRGKLSHRCRDPHRAHVVLLGFRILPRSRPVAWPCACCNLKHLFRLLTSFCP